MYGLNFRQVGANWDLLQKIIYRSGNIDLLADDESIRFLQGIAVEHIYDLRTDGEISNAELTSTFYPILYTKVSMGNIGYNLRNNTCPKSSDYALYYWDILHENVDSIYTLFSSLSKISTAPFVFGCFTGKDRTGVISYLLLSLLNAPIEILIDDYISSKDYLIPKLQLLEYHRLRKGLTREQYAQRMTPQAETIEILNRMVIEKYGSVEGYLSGIGIDVLTLHNVLYRRLR